MMIWLSMAAAAEWSLGGAHWVESVTVPELPSELHLQEGIAFEVRWEGRTVGAVFVGRGEVLLPGLTEGESLASQVALGRSWEGPWKEPVDRAIWVSSSDTVPELLGSLPAAWSQGSAWMYRDAEGMENVVVTELDLARARAKAESVLEDRERSWTAASLSPALALKLDDLSPLDVGARTLLSVGLVQGAGGLVGVPAGASPFVDQVADGSGSVVAGRVQATLAVGAFPNDWGVRRRRISEVPGAAQRLRVDRITANVVVEAERGGSSATTDSEVQLTVVGTDAGASRIVPLAIPWERQIPKNGQPPTADGFELVGATLADGTELELLRGTFGRDVAGVSRGAKKAVTIVLPEAIGPGERATVRVRYRDRWMLRNQFEYDLGGKPQAKSLGVAVEPRAVLPRAIGQAVEPVASVRVGTVLGKQWDVLTSGKLTDHWTDGDARWSSFEATPREARVAVGQWNVHYELGARGFPQLDVATHSLSTSAKKLPIAIRSVLNFYEDLLPPLDAQRILAVEGPAVVGSVPQIRGDGSTIVLQSAYVFANASMAPNIERLIRANLEDYEMRSLAWAIAGSLWNTPAYAKSDEWIGLAMPYFYGALFHEALADREAARSWERVQDLNVRPVDCLSLTDLPRVAGGATLYRTVGGLMRSLMAEHGEKEVLAGLDSFLRGAREGRSTTADLQRELEGAVGANLSGFFDWYVRAGVRPKLTVKSSVSDGVLELEVRAEPRLDGLRVPVQVVEEGVARLVWVAMVDGVGTHRETLARSFESASADPEGWLPK